MKYVTVLQGECRVSNDPKVIFSTVLGSCVAVCLYDPVTKVGGMNHFLLPGSGSNSQGDLRYGVHSMELLINDLFKYGAERSTLLAKLFGGAAIVKQRSGIGESNASFARSFLQREGINCLARSLGGSTARRIRFQPTTGEVQHRSVPRESAFSERTSAKYLAAQSPDITLF